MKGPDPITLRDRWRSTSDHANHIKDMYDVQDIQLFSFKHVHCRGASPEVCIQWIRGKGGASTHLQPVSQGCPFPMKFDGSPLEVHEHYYAQPTKMHTMLSMPFYHTPDTTHFLLGWSNTTATQSPKLSHTVCLSSSHHNST